MESKTGDTQTPATDWPIDTPTPSATDSNMITVLPCIMARPGNPSVYEKFGRKSTLAVDVKLPIVLANGVTINIPCSLWGRLTAGENGLKTVFDLSFAKGIGVDDDSKILTNQIKDQIGKWEGWTFAAAEAHRRLTTVQKKAATVDLDYQPKLKPGLVGTGLNVPQHVVKSK